MPRDKARAPGARGKAEDAPPRRGLSAGKRPLAGTPPAVAAPAVEVPENPDTQPRSGWFLGHFLPPMGEPEAGEASPALDPAVHDHAGRLRQLADPKDPSNPNNSLSPQDMYQAWLDLWSSRDDTARPRREQLEEQIRARNPAVYADKMDMFRAGRRDALGPEYEAAADEADLCAAQLSVMSEVLEWLEARKAMGERVTLDQVNLRALETARAKSIYVNVFMTALLVGFPIAAARTSSSPPATRPAPRAIAAETPASARGVADESPAAARAAPGSRLKGVPQIKAGPNREMLGQALDHLKRIGGSAADKAAAFEEMAAEISSLSGGSWNAVRTVGADGAHIFTGELGHAVVISPTGQVFLGNVAPAARNFSFGSGGLLQPLYDSLRPVQ
jgi:hypothetical protein